MSTFVDNRTGSSGKASGDRKRFLDRYKGMIKESVDKEFGERSITDIDKGGKVSIPKRGLEEPYLHHDQSTGERDIVLPGNHEYIPGDLIERPRGGQGKGSGNEPGEGDSQDNFSFVLTPDEYMALFFDDLELPNIEKTQIGEIISNKKRRAGFSREGIEINLNAQRTFKQAIARKIAIRGARRSTEKAIEELQNRRQNADEKERAEIDAEIEKLSGPTIRRGTIAGVIEQLKKERETASEDELILIDADIKRLTKSPGHIPYLSTVDYRYRAYKNTPEPSFRAVMFCMMDVSGSMDEERKDLAKRFFTLLYFFLLRKYGQVEIVFVRHTEHAEEVDEKTFFHDRQSGGTKVLPALQLTKKIIEERYQGSEWNIYIAQASDGDCFDNDGDESADYVETKLLPMVRYYAYVDVRSLSGFHGLDHNSPLWKCYRHISDPGFAMRKIAERSHIWPVFRELFKKKEEA